MPKLFKDSSKPIMSAKDFIDKKRNLTLYNDFGNNGVSRKIAHKYDNGRLKNANNHENLLYLTKGYYDHHQTIDVNNSLIQNYESQVFRNNCSKQTEIRGTSNYNGKVLVNQNIDGTQTFHDTKFANVTQYGEIIEETGVTITNQQKKENVFCFQFPLHNLNQKTC